MVWLVWVARAFYQKHLGFLMRSNPNWSATVLFYLLFVFGLLVFVIVPSLETGSTKKVHFGQLHGIRGWQVVAVNRLSPNDETGNKAYL